jgi:hypothetical protein
MSTDWNIYCRTCGSEHRFSDDERLKFFDTLRSVEAYRTGRALEVGS